MLTKDINTKDTKNSNVRLNQPTDEIKITNDTNHPTNAPLVYIESYGCQMNFSDSEIVASILKKEGYHTTSKVEEASLILLNTCSIRDKAEQTIRKRIQSFDAIKNSKPYVKIGILGCMAERLKAKLLEEEQKVDLVVGPDAYRSLPSLINEVESGQKAVNVLLSKEETYDDISPVRLSSNGISAFISIMRGCDNMCSFCVVPFTRGRERSRNIKSILDETQQVLSEGYKEITLLGQNVDSYRYTDKDKNTFNFAQLLEKVAQQSPHLRVRFSTSHPKDITDEVLYTIKKYDNICKYIHLPVQSGNSRVLEKMNRTYNRAWYLERIQRIRDILGERCGISSDMIAGFCSETEEEHQDTLSLMDKVKFDFSYMFYYSERPGTLAGRKYEDDIPLVDKKRRLQEIIDRQQIHSEERNKTYIGNTYTILVEGISKRSKNQFKGRTSSNKVVIVDKGAYQKGDYIKVKINACTPATSFGEFIQSNESIV